MIPKSIPAAAVEAAMEKIGCHVFHDDMSAAIAAALDAMQPEGGERHPLWKQIEDIERRLMAQIGMPDSMSIKLALDQFANELHGLFSSTEREACAKLVRETMKLFKPGAPVMALAIAERAVLRGRHLTESEKLENLAASMDGEDPELAAAIRNRPHAE